MPSALSSGSEKWIEQKSIVHIKISFPMKIYDDKHIKNIVLLGAPKSGKTLLAEDMLFEAGITHRRGTIEGKNTISDCHEIEQERGNSVCDRLAHRMARL
jgi:translation elongation factor EF-G